MAIKIHCSFRTDSRCCCSVSPYQGKMCPNKHNTKCKGRQYSTSDKERQVHRIGLPLKS
jgi:hypothetical protein